MLPAVLLHPYAKADIYQKFESDGDYLRTRAVIGPMLLNKAVKDRLLELVRPFLVMKRSSITRNSVYIAIRNEDFRTAQTCGYFLPKVSYGGGLRLRKQSRRKTPRSLGLFQESKPWN